MRRIPRQTGDKLLAVTQCNEFELCPMTFKPLCACYGTQLHRQSAVRRPWLSLFTLWSASHGDIHVKNVYQSCIVAGPWALHKLPCDI